MSQGILSGALGPLPKDAPAPAGKAEGHALQEMFPADQFYALNEKQAWWFMINIFQGCIIWVSGPVRMQPHQFIGKKAGFFHGYKVLFPTMRLPRPFPTSPACSAPRASWIVPPEPSPAEGGSHRISVPKTHQHLGTCWPTCLLGVPT